MLAIEMVGVGRDLGVHPCGVPSQDVANRFRAFSRGVRRHASRPSEADPAKQQVDKVDDDQASEAQEESLAEP